MADIEKKSPTLDAAANEVGSSNSSESIDPIAEKKLLLKCDLHVVPILFVLFLLAFLDRINIGNARLQGLEDDLGMDGLDFNIALFIFFIPYILCEVPSNILLKQYAPSTWLSGIMVAWGKNIKLLPHNNTHTNNGISPCLRHCHDLSGTYSELCWLDPLSLLAWCVRSRFLSR
jgi:hypothetical protein